MEGSAQTGNDRLGKVALLVPAYTAGIFFAAMLVSLLGMVLSDFVPEDLVMRGYIVVSMASFTVLLLSIPFTAGIALLSMRGNRRRMWRALGGLGIALGIVTLCVAGHVVSTAAQRDALRNMGAESPVREVR